MVLGRLVGSRLNFCTILFFFLVDRFRPCKKKRERGVVGGMLEGDKRSGRGMYEGHTAENAGMDRRIPVVQGIGGMSMPELRNYRCFFQAC